MLTFDQPWMLAGTAAAAIPLAIHLLDRRRPRPVAFSAIDFVLRSQRQSRRRLRLRRLLVFLARTLLLLAIPIALARPRLGSAPEVASRGEAAATAIVLDGSLSMTYRLMGLTLFEKAQKQAAEALRDLRPEDSATFELCLPTTPSPDIPGFDRAALLHKIEESRVSHGPVDLQGCLQKAAAALGESPLHRKRIVVATNLAAANFRLDGPKIVISSPGGTVVPEVVLLDPSQGKELANLAITRLRMEPSSALGTRGYTFVFTVQNFSNVAANDVTTTLRIEDQVVARGAVSIPARGSTEKALGFRFVQGGTFRGDVEVTPDNLPDDDRRYFVARVPRDLRALVVDGAGSSFRLQDEAFFVDTALAAPGSPVQSTTVDADAFNQLPLASGLDSVLLVDVRELDERRVQELTTFVEGGGGLLISLGPQVDADRYRALGSLLPRPLRVVKTAAEPGTPGSELRAERFSEMDWSHPIFSIFDGEARESLMAASTFRYFLLEPGKAEDLRVLASFNDGAPALVTYTRGRGRILLYLSTFDRKWSDWPIRPSFLPAIQRMVGFVAGALDDRDLTSGVVGTPYPVESPREATAVLEGPNHQTLRLTSLGGTAGSSFVPDIPGVYRFHSTKSSDPDPADFAINVDPRDSDLKKVTPEALSNYLGEDVQRPEAEQSLAHREAVPVWTALLLVAGFFLISEGVLLFGSRRSELKPRSV